MAEENEKAVLDRKAQEHEMNELKRRIHAAAEAIRSKLLSDAENRSFESELSDLKAKAESGDKDAATEYGWNLISGFATGTPDPEGWTFLKTAADAGHPKALFQVGIAFLQGIGIPKNGEKGVGFIKRSAEAGYPKGMALYARMLKEGNGVEKNEPESVMWLKRKPVTRPQSETSRSRFRRGMVCRRILSGRQISSRRRHGPVTSTPATGTPGRSLTGSVSRRTP